MKKKILGPIFLLCFISGCANPINQVTAERYFNEGQSALAKGDYENATEAFKRSLVNVRLGHLGKTIEGEVAVKYAEALGLNCQYDQAGSMFEEAITLHIEADGIDSDKVASSRLMYSQFLYDIGNFAEFTKQFGQALPTIENRLKTEYPDMYVQVMYMYAVGLDEVSDSETSDYIQNQIMEFRPATSLSKVGQEIDPSYGENCS